MTDLEAKTLRALDDLHNEFVDADKNLFKEYSGPSKTADQRIRLIDTYSKAVERVLAALPTGRVVINNGSTDLT